MNTYGTCGDVVFDIRPGSYNGKLILNNPVCNTYTAASHSVQRMAMRQCNDHAQYNQFGYGCYPYERCRQYHVQEPDDQYCGILWSVYLYTVRLITILS
ncbi:MAG: hypothetical protein H6551_01275 [Chitinophagales bacterium]|nr:hypothetical protein [Chitinophagales bacterium]